MSLANIVRPTAFESAAINVGLSNDTYELPEDVQVRVKINWEDFASRAESKTGRRPTKGGIGVLRDYRVLTDGLEGTCSVVPFDQVLYFARTQIPQGDYALGKKVGFPLASWAILVSKDDKVLFVRKKGAEGAYENNPYSGFGSLVAPDKDFETGRLHTARFLDRSVGGEVGQVLWNARKGVNYLGMNEHDENSSKVNNGYDLSFEVGVDLTADKLLASLTEDPQFTSKKESALVLAEPEQLRRFAESNPTTHSGIIGLFGYIGSKFGIDEAKKQFEIYRKSGKNLEIIFETPFYFLPHPKLKQPIIVPEDK